jgi:RNA polymerase sigma-70 factor (ECF subfamily)
LLTVVRNRLWDFRDSRRRHCQGSGDPRIQAVLEEQPAREDDLLAWWDREHEWHLLNWAAGQVRPAVRETTWQAFWQTAIEGKGGEEVARALGLSVAAVYLARSRIMARIRELIRQVEGD